MSAIGTDDFNKNSLVIMGVFAIGYLPVIWIACALMAKRLHDMNRSGWWMLLTIVPILGMIYALYISLNPGKPEPNRFGHANPAQGWEKPVGIIGIILTVALVGGALVVDGMSMFGML